LRGQVWEQWILPDNRQVEVYVPPHSQWDPEEPERKRQRLTVEAGLTASDHETAEAGLTASDQETAEDGLTASASDPAGSASSNLVSQQTRGPDYRWQIMRRRLRMHIHWAAGHIVQHQEAMKTVFTEMFDKFDVELDRLEAQAEAERLPEAPEGDESPET
jgi:hypothetical protein